MAHLRFAKDVMTPTVPMETEPVDAMAPTLEGFFEHLRFSNPFDGNRVVPGFGSPADATNVHGAAFGKLLDLIQRMKRSRESHGAIVWGEAGIGKSHLLDRLRQWADADKRQAVFLYVANLQSAPEHLPRSLLKCVANILTRGRQTDLYDTPLYRFVNAAIRHALNYEDGKLFTWQQAVAAYDDLVARLCATDANRAAVFDRQALGVLFRFFRSAYHAKLKDVDDGVAVLATRWLSGEALELDEAKQLDLNPTRAEDGFVGLADDQQIKQVLSTLALLASYRSQPLILCLDQLDTLEPEQFAALARFLHALLDNSSNLLVITAGVRESLERKRLEASVLEGSWDRLAQFSLLLHRISTKEARQIIQVRLERFLDPFLGLEPLRAAIHQDDLFPLGGKWAEQTFQGKTEVRARDVINWAREEWERQQELLAKLGGECWLREWSREIDTITRPDQPPADFVNQRVVAKHQELKRQRLLAPETLPPDGENLAGLVESLLQRRQETKAAGALADVHRPAPAKGNQRPAYHLVLHYDGPDGKEVRRGLLCLVTSNRMAAAFALRRIVHDATLPEHVIIVTDDRVGLDLAAKGKEHFEHLGKRLGDRFQHFQLTFDDYANLDALQAVIGLARSGDLEASLPGGKTQRIREDDVVASPHWRNSHRSHPLLKALLQLESEKQVSTPALGGNAGDQGKPGNGPPPEGSPGSERDLREFIRGKLAIAQGASSKELAAQYQHYLDAKGLRWIPELCKRRIEEAALQLHHEGLVHATPLDDHLYVLNR